MFGRKDNAEAAPQETNVAQPRTVASDVARPSPTGVARRIDQPHSGSRPASNPRNANPDERRLTVGKGLSVTGEITACDVLVVEGRVEAKLSEGKLLEITESGQFRGNVEIENADIAGRYDGQLVVHGRLTVRGSGRVSGMIKYGELEINAGGQIIGELQVVGGQAQPAAGQGSTSFKSAAKFTALTDEDEETQASRKVANS